MDIILERTDIRAADRELEEYMRACCWSSLRTAGSGGRKSIFRRLTTKSCAFRQNFFRLVRVRTGKMYAYAGLENVRKMRTGGSGNVFFG